MSKVSPNYVLLSELNRRFRSGNIIVENTLFVVDKGSIEDYYELSDGTIEEKVEESRILADLSNRSKIVVDDINYYSADVILDEGELITASESYSRLSEEEQDDFDSFAEHYMGL